jgi:hypothetical protein
LPGIDTSETAEIPLPIMPKATKNQGDWWSPSKKELVFVFLEVIFDTNIKTRKYPNIMVSKEKFDIDL